MLIWSRNKGRAAEDGPLSYHAPGCELHKTTTEGCFSCTDVHAKVRGEAFAVEVIVEHLRSNVISQRLKHIPQEHLKQIADAIEAGWW